MPRINMAGASGLPPNIVEQLMAAERAPIQAMEAKKTDIDAKLTLVNEFEGRVRQLKDGLKELTGVGGFQDYSLNMSQEGVLTGAVDPAQAQTGSWSLEVLELPEAAGAMTNGFPDKNETKLGVGYLKFETSEGTKEVYINDSNNTLSGVANAVNTSGIGVRASVVKDADDSDDAYKIIFSGEGFGDGNTMEFPTVYLLDGDQDFYFDEERVAKNGKMKVNGFEIEVDEKKLQELIPGVTLDLQSANPGKEVVVSVSENFEVIEGKIGEFVSAVNGVLGFIQSQNRMDENTDTSKTLGGDSMVRSIEGRMRRLLQGGLYAQKPGEIKRLADLGVEYNRAGTVDFKQDKFDAALRSNPTGVLKFLKGDGSKGSGFVGKVNEFVNEVTQSFGVISNKKKGLESRTQRIDRNIENKERLLARKEQGLRRKFSRMEETIGRLKGQGNAIGQIGANPGIQM